MGKTRQKLGKTGEKKWKLYRLSVVWNGEGDEVLFFVFERKMKKIMLGVCFFSEGKVRGEIANQGKTEGSRAWKP